MLNSIDRHLHFSSFPDINIFDSIKRVFVQTPFFSSFFLCRHGSTFVTLLGSPYRNNWPGTGLEAFD